MKAAPIIEELRSLDVDGSTMEVFLFRPDREVSLPAILLAQHLPVGHTGIENDTFTLETARRFARAGYVVAVPFLFHWWPKDESMERKRSESLDSRMVADMTAGYRLLAADSAVDAHRIAIVGHCWGGRVAWLAACHLPGCAALAVFYGGNIGKGLGPDSVPPLQLADRIMCPVIGLFGDEDSNPSPQDVDRYDEALSAAGVRHEFFQYEGAGHAFQNFPNPERYHAGASEDAWQQVLGFLQETLA